MSSTKKTKKSCIWNRRGGCSEKVIERLTQYDDDDWKRTTPGKALLSDNSIDYCNFCLMSKLVEQVEELNENLVKIYKKLRPIP